MLIDAYADRLFAAQDEMDDILVFREMLAVQSPALGHILALASHRPNGPRLITEAVEVPLDEYVKLSVEDFMVSLYNGQTVQRVRLVLPDGSRLAIHDVLAEAIASCAAVEIVVNALFICTANRLRSPTAEQVFSTWAGVETDSGPWCRCRGAALARADRVGRHPSS